MDVIGRILVAAGLALALFGLLYLLIGRLTGWRGLPGDLSFHRDGVTIYVPIVTSILISIILTIVLNIILRLIFRG
jgi:hypothetical protein